MKNCTLGDPHPYSDNNQWVVSCEHDIKTNVHSLMKVAVKSPKRLDYCETWASAYQKIMTNVLFGLYSHDQHILMQWKSNTWFKAKSI